MKRILISDYRLSARELLRSVLENAGYEVMAARFAEVPVVAMTAELMRGEKEKTRPAALPNFQGSRFLRDL